VLFLHGLGDTGHGWSDAMAMLAKGLPHVKFILPTAAPMPITLNMGMRMPAWYDIKSLARVSGDSADGIDNSRDRIMALIEKEVGDLVLRPAFAFAPETANVPLLMCHGEADPVVRFEFGKMSKEKLAESGVKDIEFHSYPDMEHGACMEELDDVTKWLQRVIPDTQS
ncbi:hypothetical protein BBJ28_00008724, partial [Nothophytophthora sp. Chile5]